MNYVPTEFDRTQEEWAGIILESGNKLKAEKIESIVAQIYKGCDLAFPSIIVFDSYIEHKLRICREEPGRFGQAIIHKLQQLTSAISFQVDSKLDISPTQGVPNEPTGISFATSHKNTTLFPILNREIAPIHEATITQLKRRFQKTKAEFVEHGFGLANEFWLCLFYHLMKNEWLEEIDTSYFQLIVAGIWSADFYSKAVFVSPPPSKILRNENRRLHSTKESAIQWRDGSGLYFIDGVGFEKWLWEQLAKKEMPCGHISKIINLEQRRAALTLYDFDEIIREQEGYLIERSRRGNELYGLNKVIPGEIIKFLRYKDPSTDRIYTCFVPESCERADEAMAWKFYLTEEDYENLREEA